MTESRVGDMLRGMAILILRNVSPDIMRSLKHAAAEHGRSVEDEHREILRVALIRPPRPTVSKVLASMPDVGDDEDFAR